jgi:hypothetical protein
MATMDLICGGVLEGFPRLRLAFLEAGGTWVSYWLERLDEFHEKIGYMVAACKMRPSEYFRRQCFFRANLTTWQSRPRARLAGGEFLMWLHFPWSGQGVRDNCAVLPESGRRKIMR